MSSIFLDVLKKSINHIKQTCRRKKSGELSDDPRMAAEPFDEKAGRPLSESFKELPDRLERNEMVHPQRIDDPARLRDPNIKRINEGHDQKHAKTITGQANPAPGLLRLRHEQIVGRENEKKKNRVGKMPQQRQNH